MTAVDTNILVYAHREDAPWHAKAEACLRELAEGRRAWAIPWPCIHEFLAIVTHARIFAPPTPLSRAIAQVAAWLESPSLVVIAETGSYWADLRLVLERGHVSGAMAHDARIAALCRHHGVRELWSVDRDFSRFPDLKVVNPLAPGRS